MWLIFVLIGLALVAALFGVAVVAIIAIAIKLMPALLIAFGAWLLLRAIFGSRRDRSRDANRWQRHAQRHGQWQGWEQRQVPHPSGRPTEPIRPVRSTATTVRIPTLSPTPTPPPTPAPPPPPPPTPRRELPIDVRVKVEQIKRKADLLLEYADRFPPFSQDLHIVRQTAADYLPRTVDAYLKLPGSDDPVIGATGKTALDELKAQLNLLDSKLDEIAEDLQRQDLDRMLANRRFLEERFKLRDQVKTAGAATGEIDAA